MKKLYISLYIFVFLALIGIGWVIESVYQSVDTDEHSFPEIIEVFESYKSLLENNEKISSLPSVFQIESLKSLNLPDPLNVKLLDGEIVILNSIEGVSFHQILKNQQTILSLGPISVSKQDIPWLNFALTFLFYTGIAIILLIWLRPLLRDVNVLSYSLNKVTTGELSSRIKQKSYYLDKLFEDFNQMAQTLELLNENNQLFSQAVSHDIRTPLSRILFALESLDNHDNKAVNALSHSIRSDVLKIESLTKELLEYSRLEAIQVNLDEFDLVMLIEQVIAGFDHVDCQINFKHDGDFQLIKLDADLIQKVINNLLSNALRFANKAVCINIIFSDFNLKLIVEDDGQGIDFKSKNIEELCKPFVQKEREDKHFGLGLAIVSRSIKLMHGSLMIDNTSDLGGACFTVIIPVIKSK